MTDQPNNTTKPDDGSVQTLACAACGNYPKLQKTADPGIMQLSHLCAMGTRNDCGEFAAESDLITLWNRQQNHHSP